jgi:hypothetical protein
MWSAEIEGRDGTFVVNQPDMDGLKLPLTKEATPSPSPSATPTSSPTAAPL